MLTQLRKTWPWAAGLAAFYTVVPSVWGAIARWSAPEDTTADKGVIFSCLVGLNPAVTLAVGAFVGYRHGFAWVCPALAAAALVPAVYLLLHDSALPSAVIYGVFALIGLLVGWGVRALLNRRLRAVAGEGRPIG